MIRGVLIAFATYAVFSFSDASLKAASGSLNVIQMSFMATIFSSVVVFFLKPRTEQWVDMVRMNRPGLVLLRAGAGIAATLLSAYGFTTLPLADAYSLLFLLPMFVALLSFLFLREKPGWARSLAVLVGLAGVVLVVRPGFREIMPGHFAALGAALCGAVTILILRVVNRTERQVAIMGTLMVGMLLVSGGLTLFVFRPPTLLEVGLLALSGALAGLGHLGMLAATRHAPASRVGPVQYSQIVWAVILGALFFSEFPDWISIIGMALVCGSGLLTFFRDEVVQEPVGDLAR